MHHHGPDGECHIGYGGLLYCNQCEDYYDNLDAESEAFFYSEAMAAANRELVTSYEPVY
jgi:hypothetical protein